MYKCIYADATLNVAVYVHNAVTSKALTKFFHKKYSVIHTHQSKVHPLLKTQIKSQFFIDAFPHSFTKMSSL